MTEIKPIKRSVHLQPLSREHHDGLLFVWKIRQAINNHADIEKMKALTAWYWKNHIKPHFNQEEKVLLPFFPPFDPMAVRIKEEHDYIRELIIAIDREPVIHDFIQLCNLIESHIRFEEREFFVALEQNVSEQELSDIHQQLKDKSVECKLEWTDNFWEKKR